MSERKNGLNDIVQVVTEQADTVYRFCYTLTGDGRLASELTFTVFAKTQNNISTLLNQSSEELRTRLLTIASHEKAKPSPKSKKPKDSDWQELILSLPDRERSSFVLTDVFGLEKNEIQEILDFSSQEELRVFLLAARKKILNTDSIEGSAEDREFVLRNLADILSGQLEGEVKKQFEVLKAKNSDQLDAFYTETRKQLGKIQLGMQSFYAPVDLKERLVALGEGDDVRQTREAQEIESLGRSEVFGRFRRAFFLVAGMAGLAIAAVYYFYPHTGKLNFEPLEAISYETAAFIEDWPSYLAWVDSMEGEDYSTQDLVDHSRLDYLTSSYEEINQFAKTHRDIDFEVGIPNLSSLGWKIDGGTVLDYDQVFVLAVQYSKGNELVVYYAFPYEMSLLPTAPQGKVAKGGNTLVYQTYENTIVNLVVWQQFPSVLGVMAGKLGAVDLAKLGSIGNSSF